MWLVLLTVDSRHVVACRYMLGLWLPITMPRLIHTPQGRLVKYLCKFLWLFFFNHQLSHYSYRVYMLHMHVPLWAVSGRNTRFINHKKMSLHQRSVIFSVSILGVTFYQVSVPQVFFLWPTCLGCIVLSAQLLWHTESSLFQ